MTNTPYDHGQHLLDCAASGIAYEDAHSFLLTPMWQRVREDDLSEEEGCADSDQCGDEPPDEAA
jgi:hypothetical protein